MIDPLRVQKNLRSELVERLYDKSSPIDVVIVISCSGKMPLHICFTQQK